MRRFITFISLVFLQSCVAQDTVQENALYFPFEKQYQQEKSQETANYNAHDLLISEKGSQTYVYLALFEAIKREDYEKIILFSNELAANNPDPLYMAESITWLYNKGYLDDAKALLEKSLPLLPDELPLIMMYVEILKQEGNNTVAVDLLKNYIKKHPTDYFACIELGVLYYSLFQYQEAYESFLQIPLEEQNHTVNLYLGTCLEKLQRIDEAKSYYQKALKAFPEDKTALHHLGQIAEMQKNYVLAEKYYKKILELEGTNYDYLLKLMNVYFKQGNHQKAYNLAKEYFNFEFIMSASSMLIQEGRADLAEQLLNNLSNMENAPRELLFLHGALIYEAGKDKNRALSYLTQIQEDEQYYKNAQEVITQIYLEQGEFEKVLECLKKLQEVDPNSKNYPTMEYQIYLQLKQYENAYEVLYQYLKDYPDDMYAKFHFAYVNFYLDEKDRAVEIMQEIVDAEPDNYEALNFVGYSLVEKKKDLKRAEKYLLKADSLNPKQGYINDSLAWLYYNLGDYEKAYSYIEKAVVYSETNTTQDATMWEHYGDIAMKQGKKNIARAAYKKSLSIKDNEKVKAKLQEIR